MTQFYKNIKLFVFACSIFLVQSEIEAQDANFSQFYSAPVQMNPALTGVFAGEFRLVTNYRTQYYSVLGDQSYKTIAASIDARRKVGRDDYFSFGLAVLKDQVGQSDFSKLRAVLSGSYLKHLGGGRYRSSDQFLVGGFQLGVGQWSFDPENLWFNEQFLIDGQNSRIDQTLSNGETNLNNFETDMFVDFNAGLLYYNVFDENNSFHIGGAMHHINEPNVAFFQDVDNLHSRWSAQAGGELSVTREVSLLPAVAVMSQGSSFQTIGGMSLRYNNHDWREVAIRAGLWGRLSNQGEDKMGMDAIVVSAILEVERFQFGLSYDITVSDLSSANNSRGAFELSVIYVHPEKQRFRVSCPRL